MADWITSMVRSFGYVGILLLMFLENVFPPVPSELIMPFAGMVASRGDLSLWGVILAGTAGAVLGALPLYYLGSRIGIDRLKDWADRYGHWVAVSPEDIDRANTWFDRHGTVVVFVCRLVPAVRSIISIPAGANRMSLPLFLLLTTLGAGLWTALLAYFGRILGQNYGAVQQYLDPVTYGVVAILGGAFLWRIIRRQWGSKGRRGSERRSRAHQRG